MPILPSPVFIPEGAPNQADAKKFIDFMLSKEGQEVIVNDVLAYASIKGMPPPKGIPAIDDVKTWVYDWKEVYRVRDDVMNQMEPILQRKK